MPTPVMPGAQAGPPVALSATTLLEDLIAVQGIGPRLADRAAEAARKYLQRHLIDSAQVSEAFQRGWNSGLRAALSRLR